MSVKVTINDSLKVLEVPKGKLLFQALSGAGLFVPSACGGKGLCGLCRVRVRGAGPFTEAEMNHLSDEEREDSVRLACQVKLENDVQVFLSDDELAAKLYRTKVTIIKDMTESIKEVTVSCDASKSPVFKAGQFMLLRIPAYSNVAFSAFRSYSIATSPEEKGGLKFLVRLVENGYASTYIHNHLKEGDQLSLVGPFGDFYLRESDKNIIMIAGGSGMAPMRSILKYMSDHKINRTVHFFFGGHDEDDLFYEEEMAHLGKNLPNFKFYPCVDVVKKSWSGDVGNVVQTATKHLTPEEIANSQGYLCGGPGMLNAAISFLTSKGMSENEIFYDKFG